MHFATESLIHLRVSYYKCNTINCNSIYSGSFQILNCFGAQLHFIISFISFISTSLITFQFYLVRLLLIFIFIQSDSNMEACMKAFFDAPVNHFKQIRQLSMDQLLLKKTKFSPAYPIMLLVSLLTFLAFQGYIIYYFFTASSHPCLKNIAIGVDCLSILYLIISLVIYLGLVGSIGKSGSVIWKIILIIFFGEFVTGLGFGGLGVTYICILNNQYPSVFNGTFITNDIFTQAVVYIYLSFILLYLVVGPLFAWVHARRAKQQKKEKDGCDIFLCIVHYTFQILLLLTFIFVAFIMILGPVALFMCFIEAAKAINNKSSTQQVFLGLGITSMFSPFIIFLVSYLISIIACSKEIQSSNSQLETKNSSIESGKSEIKVDKPLPSNQVEPGLNNTLLTSRTTKEFADEKYTIKNTNL